MNINYVQNEIVPYIKLYKENNLRLLVLSLLLIGCSTSRYTNNYIDGINRGLYNRAVKLCKLHQGLIRIGKLYSPVGQRQYYKIECRRRNFYL